MYGRSAALVLEIVGEHGLEGGSAPLGPAPLPDRSRGARAHALLHDAEPARDLAGTAPNVGDTLLVKLPVVLNKDFVMCYQYDVIVEDAEVTVE